MTIFAPSSDPAIAPSGEVAYWAYVTPKKAKEVLETYNTHNRKFRSKATRDKITRDINNGKFETNGETIKFHINAEGNIEVDDGQHRLQGVVDSGKPIFSLVVEELKASAQKTVDLGAKRSVGEQLAFDGITNTSAKASIARVLLVYVNSGKIISTGGDYTFSPSDIEIEEFVRIHDEALNHSVQRIHHFWNASGLSLCVPAVVGAIHYICGAALPVLADDFFGDQLVQGLNVERNTPAHAFRVANSFDKKKKWSHVEQYGYLTKSWNAYRKGANVVKLVPPQGGWTKDNVPKLNLAE